MRAAALVLTAVLVATASVAVVHGHKKEAPSGVRELVRIQGYRGDHQVEVPVVRTAAFLVLGQEHSFQATAWRRFGLNDRTESVPDEKATRFTLQGDRTTLRRFSKARPDQVVTILAERRTGASDLFVLALDLCPAD
jgi:hypothetical protein